MTRIQQVATAPAGLTRYGTGAPGTGTGNVGDYYVDEATGNLYGPKLSVGAPKAVASSYSATAPTIPAAAPVGSTLIASVLYAGAAPATQAGGWTLIGQGGYNTNDNRTTVVYWKTCAAGDPGSALSWAAPSAGEGGAQVVAYSQAGAPVGLFSGHPQYSGSTAAQTYPAVAGNSATDLLLLVDYMCVGSNISSAPVWTCSSPSGAVLRQYLGAGGDGHSDSGPGWTNALWELEVGTASITPATTAGFANGVTTYNADYGGQRGGMFFSLPAPTNVWPLYGPIGSTAKYGYVFGTAEQTALPAGFTATPALPANGIVTVGGSNTLTVVEHANECLLLQSDANTPGGDAQFTALHALPTGWSEVRMKLTTHLSASGGTELHFFCGLLLAGASGTAGTFYAVDMQTTGLMEVTMWNSLGSFNSSLGAFTEYGVSTPEASIVASASAYPVWFRYLGSSGKAQWSADGLSWNTIATISSFTPTQFGIITDRYVAGAATEARVYELKVI